MGRQGDLPPIFFQKSIVTVAHPVSTRGDGSLKNFIIRHPGREHELSYEGELVILIGKSGFQIAREHAEALIAGFAAGLDLTLRDVQREVCASGKPWFPAKNFPGASVVGAFVERKHLGRILESRLTLRVNGDICQDASLSEMLNPPDALIASLSQRVALVPGDLIFTGTPSGTGALLPGDLIELHITGLPPIKARVD